MGPDRGATAKVIMQVASISTIEGGTAIRAVSLSQSTGRARQPAHLHGDQVNPRVTGDSGYSAFSIASGFYHRQVGAVEGYQWWPSPVVQVISEGVHVNVPTTPWPGGGADQVTLTPSGPDPTVITVPVGSRVEWVSTLAATASITGLVCLTEDPMRQPRTGGAPDPLTNSLGFDGGRMVRV